MMAEKKTSRTNRACEIIARLALVFSLWQAPIPWLHSHDFHLPDDTSPISLLKFTEHLQRFHGINEISQDVEFGWHCHWIVPPWMHAINGKCDHEENPGESIVVDSLLLVPASFDSSVSFLREMMPDSGASYRFCPARCSYLQIGIMAPQRYVLPFSAVLRC